MVSLTARVKFVLMFKLEASTWYFHRIALAYVSIHNKFKLIHKSHLSEVALSFLARRA
ncbi:hypothetical protein THF5H11_11128 [Vibrio jasicida]|uniref:DUF3265 domain-containing protein n=1 Tax=Vibrio jasicida TaxID=766224 RepID=A0AAU9QPM9_9VIBR|nr:hypothetical protein THF5H11_11128 [Vibrio jasicida]CAH1587149.1 hypothetical protein THF1C08_290039 [Vibrio jasicida]CAH1594319.1 hypothetical protein THF1A12_280039 [Vibrio jasicida]